MSRALSLALAAACAACGPIETIAPAPLADADTAKTAYRAGEVTGDVVEWTPTTGAWMRLVPGSIVPLNAVLHAAGGVKLTLEPATSAAAREVDVLRLTMEEPTTFRASPDLKRQMRGVKSLDVEPDDMKTSNPGGKTPPPETLPLAAAWMRDEGLGTFLANLKDASLSALKPLVAKRMGAKAPMAVRNLVRKIKVSHPEPGGILLAGAERTIAVSWELPDRADGEPLPLVQVFLWTKEDSQPHPVLATNAGFAPLRFEKAGGYYVQIQAQDGSAQSNAIYFVVEFSNKPNKSR